MVGAQQIGVLGVDGGDEVVQSEHLDGGEETDELEPPGVKLVGYRVTVQDTKDGVGQFCLRFCGVLDLFLDVDGLVCITKGGAASGGGWRK